MLNIKRAVVVSGGVFAIAAASAMTVAAGPGSTVALNAAGASHESAAASTAGRTTADATPGASATALHLSSSLNSPDAAPDATTGPLQTNGNTSAPSASAKSRGQGNSFGKLISSLAHVITAGPDHGQVISFFAKALNHGHTSHPATTPKGTGK